jgi:hypothetical protein
VDVKLRRLIFKTAIFALSLSLAWWLVKAGYLSNLVSMVLPIKFAAEFLAGIFYVSFLTAPISLAMLLVLADVNNPILTALLAGFGAAFADLVIVKFFEKKLSKDINFVTDELRLKKVNNILIKFKLEFITPLIGAIIVASPLPDEFGLMLLGASKLSFRQIAVLTYVLNTAGILLIVVPVNLLS